jgi:hypothetical protein
MTRALHRWTPPWQPIATAPKDADFLVWHRDRIRQVTLYGGGPDFLDPGTVIDATAGRMWVARHWIPLPEPPK